MLDLNETQKMVVGWIGFTPLRSQVMSNDHNVHLTKIL
jgi:hypothetical protein